MNHPECFGLVSINVVVNLGVRRALLTNLVDPATSPTQRVTVPLADVGGTQVSNKNNATKRIMRAGMASIVFMRVFGIPLWGRLRFRRTIVDVSWGVKISPGLPQEIFAG